MDSNPTHSLLTYLRLKIVASIIRFLLPLVNYVPKARPDRSFTIKSRTPNHVIKANVYASQKSQGKPHPVLLNWHGSGFMMPMHGQDEYFCKLVAQTTEYTVIDLNYRLAPENPFPAGLEDVRDAISHVLSHPETYDQNRIALSGFSAGAGLLLGACSLPSPTSDGGDGKCVGNLVEKIVGVYPPADLSKKPGGKRAPEGGVGTIPPWLGRIFNDAYMPPGVDRQDPRVSPTYIEVEKLPRDILFITCGKDNLAWEAEKMIGKIQNARKGESGHVSFRRFDGVHHGWDKAPKKGSEDEKKRDEAYELIINFLNHKV